ncbi:globin family protein [Alteromonas facilis]|uniref:globin family protein n=1 Tax=Alteromonas facilis TaxID=2048004 RepID=UPI000C28EF0C|nr:globin family protein [Alteromonas facilis]
MSLSEKDKVLVQQSFQKVVPIADTAAEIFYAKLFEYDPTLKPLFKGNMKQQGQMLMSTLKAAVEGLDDISAVVETLEQLALRHVKYGVKVDDYTPVGNALLFALQQGLGDGFTADVRTAWVHVYKTIADVMRSTAYPDFDPNTYTNTKRYNH